MNAMNQVSRSTNVGPATGVQSHVDMRKLAQTMFGTAWVAQNPSKSLADVPLRGKLYVDEDTRRLLTPAQVQARQADGTLGKTPYLSWFLEAEAKLAVPDESTFNAIHEGLLQAASSGDISSLVGSKIGAPLAREGFGFEKLAKVTARDFQDNYYSTKGANGLTIRVRQVGDEIGTEKGKFTAKIQGDRVGAIWERMEVKFTAGGKIPEAAFLTPGAIPDEINPISYLKRAYPSIGRTLQPTVTIKDKRHEFLVKKPDGKDGSFGEGLYLVTLDKATAVDPKTGKLGHFQELEIERTVASDKPADRQAQLAFTSAIQNRFRLSPSTLSKAQNGLHSLGKKASQGVQTDVFQ